MNLFKLEWWWYEENDYYLFSHKEPKTQEEFQNDVRVLMNKYLDDYLLTEDSWAQASDWIRFVSTKLPELGYEPVETTTVGIFGCYIIRSDGGSEENEENKKLIELVGQEAFNKCVAHNDAVQKRCDEGRY